QHGELFRATAAGTGRQIRLLGANSSVKFRRRSFGPPSFFWGFAQPARLTVKTPDLHVILTGLALHSGEITREIGGELGDFGE
ncbi:MAG: hypothetical protein Q7J57_16450, partial [Gemmobacter sp.]|nr:hypothetical protein [Gemmobacter sp.]